MYISWQSRKSHTICEAVKIHNKNMASLVDKDDYAEGTLKRFEVPERHIKEYLSFKIKKQNLTSDR